MSKKISNYVGLPYIKGLSDEMFRILRKFNINVYTYSHKTIVLYEYILTHIKQLEIFYLK